MNLEQRAEIVIARKGEQPTKSNSVPLEHSGVGRCSLVLYSPATMFSTVGYEENSLKDIEEAGLDVPVVDWASEAPGLYPQF